jgi:hypothetical protein
LKFEYFDFNGKEAFCDLEIKVNDNITYVCFTELKENPGASVTNCMDLLIPKVQYEMDLAKNSEDVIFLERYTADSYPDGDDIFEEGEKVDLVEMRDKKVVWAPFDLEFYRKIFSRR